MARDWKGFVIWKGGGSQRSDADSDHIKFEQYMWQLDGGGQLHASDEGWAMPDAFLDASRLADHYGNVGGMTQDYRFYCQKYQLGRGGLAGFSVDGNVQVGDIYGIARCGTKTVSPGGVNGYLGIGFEVMTKTGGVVTEIRFGIVDYDGTGAPRTSEFTITEVSANVSVPMSAPVWLVLQNHRAGAGAVTVKLGVAGAYSAGYTMAAPIRSRLGRMGPSNHLHNGAGTDGGARSVRWLMAWCDGSAEADAPPTTINSINLQPNAIASQNTWNGTPQTVNKHHDVDSERNDCPRKCSYIVPTAAGSANRQTFTFPDVASGTPEAIYLIWEQGTTVDRVNAHRAVATVDGTLILASVGNFAGFHNTLGTMCDGDPDALWYGRLYATTPEATPGVWTLAKLNALEAGLEAVADGVGIFRHVGEFYVLVIGDNLVQPDKTPCPYRVRSSPALGSANPMMLHHEPEEWEDLGGCNCC